MPNTIKSKPICGSPVHSVFTGKDKYLRLQKHTISDITPPICENESLFILVNSGCGTITINGVEFPFEQSTFVWLQSYHTFTIKADSDDPLELSICVYDYPLSSFLALREPSPDTVDAIMVALPVIRLEGVYQQKIRDLFDEFEKEDSCFDPGSSLIKVSILGQFAYFFIKHGIHQSQKDQDKDWPLGWQATLYIGSHFAEDITAESVAERFSTNASTLNRELRNISGYNFAHTLNRVRVNIASGALLYEDMSLSYVAEHSGFSSEVAFYRIFKKYTGTTPLEYRKQMLESGEKVYRGMIMSQMLMDVLNHSYASFSSPIDIKDTSKSLYLSESVIRELVQEKFGASYKDITVLTRLRHAAALLLTTNLPVLDVAVNVGFNCSRSFSRAFNKLYKMTPGEYRSPYRGGENQ